ncbi:MAG: aldehyde dehydrogenase family protein, partial [Bacteroidota bacterium]
MSTGFYQVPTPTNEPVYTYATGTSEREALQATLTALQAKQVEVPLYIGSEQIKTETKKPLSPPHNHQHILGHYYEGDASHVEQAINAALGAKYAWENMAWEQRASIFLKAADLIAGKYHYQMNAATMLAQSKTSHQSEIDAVCEIVDFLRFNVKYMTEIYEQQPPISPAGVWNRVEQRPLEGFIFAITPFNFTAIAGNLPSAPAMMGNTVVWKPAETQIYSANLL